MGEGDGGREAGGERWGREMGEGDGGREMGEGECNVCITRNHVPSSIFSRNCSPIAARSTSCHTVACGWGNISEKGSL